MISIRGAFGRLAITSLIGLFAVTGAHATALTVDGDLSDWGVSVADGNGSVFTAVASGIGFMPPSFIEDQNDGAGDGGFVGPNYGGQNYDVEFMGAALQGHTLYVAIVSGLRPDNGYRRFGPGDLHVTSSLGTFGIETGGGAGGGSGDLLEDGDAGSTYTLDGHGYTTNHDAADGLQTAGSIWTGVNWIDDPIAPGTPTQFAIAGTSINLGSADYVWTRDTVTNQHSIMEMSFDVRTFLDPGGSGTLDIVWNPACGNDFAMLSLSISPFDVPEPSMGGLMAFGLLGIAKLRRRRER